MRNRKRIPDVSKKTARRNSGRTVLVILSLLAFSSCAPDPVFWGLKPIEPNSSRSCALLATRQPTLRWLAFATSTPGISDVTYELRIWEAVHGAPGRLVYAREGLPDPSHIVQEPLKTPGSYFWTVRARFLLHGMSRVTDWGQQRYRVSKDDQKHRVITHEYYHYYCFRTLDEADNLGR